MVAPFLQNAGGLQLPLLFALLLNQHTGLIGRIQIEIIQQILFRY